MSLGFTRFYGRFVLQTDLHIGDGEASDNRATFVHDAAGRPVIPGSTLKGASRARLDAADADRLFGTAKDDGTGAMGLVVFYAATLQVDTVEVDQLPRDRRKEQRIDDQATEQDSVAVATHVAIDRAHGGAEAQKLYEREIVPAGAIFCFDGVALSDAAAVACDIFTALGPFVEGLNLGHGVGKGNGRLSLDADSVYLIRRRLDTSNELPCVVDDLPQSLSIGRAASATTGQRFKFRCPGPYFSHNPHEAGPSGRDNILFSLRRGADTAVLWPESLYGVLRKRCAWIARTDDVADGDCRFRVFEDREAPSALTRTERLFGVAGWRGLVCLRDVQLGGGKRMSTNGQEIAGIALDRFSGAVLDGRLFFADAWTGLTLTFSLDLDYSRFSHPEDAALFRKLVSEIRHDGLQLGHGTNRGFGWFDFLGD